MKTMMKKIRLVSKTDEVDEFLVEYFQEYLMEHIEEFLMKPFVFVII